MTTTSRNVVKIVFIIAFSNKCLVNEIELPNQCQTKEAVRLLIYLLPMTYTITVSQEAVVMNN